MLKSSPKVRICLWKGTSTSYLPKRKAGIQLLAILPIHWLTTWMTKTRYGSLLRKANICGKKTKERLPQIPRAKGVIPCALESRVILELGNASYATPLVGKTESATWWAFCLFLLLKARTLCQGMLYCQCPEWGRTCWTVERQLSTHKPVNSWCLGQPTISARMVL